MYIDHTPKTAAEWEDIYLAKTGIDFLPEPGFIDYYLPTRGICQYRANNEDGYLHVCHCCGDVLFWEDLAYLMCIQNKLKGIKTMICRNPKAFARAMKWEIYRTEPAKDGRFNYFCVNKYGRKATLIFDSVHPESGKDLYMFTEEVEYLAKEEAALALLL